MVRMRRLLSILGIVFGFLLALEMVYFNASINRPALPFSFGVGGREIVKVGERVDDLHLQSVDGGDFRLRDHPAKVVLVNFFASW